VLAAQRFPSGEAWQSDDKQQLGSGT